MAAARNEAERSALGASLSRAIGIACAAMGVLGALLFAGVALLMVGQAGARAFGLAMVGGDEIAGWLSASAAFVALGYAFREGALIRMEVVLERLSPARRRIAELTALAVGGAWCGYMAFAMVRFVWQNAMFAERSTGLISIPIWPVQAPAALGTVLLFVVFVEQFVRVASGARAHYLPRQDDARTADELGSGGV